MDHSVPLLLLLLSTDLMSSKTSDGDWFRTRRTWKTNHLQVDWAVMLRFPWSSPCCSYFTLYMYVHTSVM